MEVKYLYLMYPTKEKRLCFLAQSALTYGVNLDSLCEMLGKKNEEAKKRFASEMLEENRQFYSALLNLFYHCPVNQTKAKSRYVEYFNNLVDAARKHDKEEMKNLISIIRDDKAMDLKNKERKPGYYLSDEETLTIVNYQIKYGLDAKRIADLYNIDYHTYLKRVRKLEDMYPEVVSYFNYLTDYYSLKYDSGKNHGMR